jgi:hypothetical protein
VLDSSQTVVDASVDSIVDEILRCGCEDNVAVRDLLSLATN